LTFLHRPKVFPTIFLENSAKNYYLSRISKQWEGGLDLCTRFDMDYVTFDSYSESVYLSTLVGNGVYWVGVNDIGNEGTFTNYNDIRKVVKQFIKWDSGQPNNLNGDENCVHVYTYSNILAYNDFPCYLYYNVACERRVPKKLPTSVQTTSLDDPPTSIFSFVGSSCELNFEFYLFITVTTLFSVFADRDYYLSRKPMSWDSGVVFCTQNDMVFAYTMDRAESDYFLTFKLNAWVGINDKSQEGDFRNYDGRRIPLTSILNWDAGEPSNGGGNEDCVQTYYFGRYNDKICSFAMRVVCMR
jgi:hypothetical protein